FVAISRRLLRTLSLEEPRCSYRCTAWSVMFSLTIQDISFHACVLHRLFVLLNPSVIKHFRLPFVYNAFVLFQWVHRNPSFLSSIFVLIMRLGTRLCLRTFLGRSSSPIFEGIGQLSGGSSQVVFRWMLCWAYHCLTMLVLFL